MGTSVSFRSPPTPRWQAFVAAMEGQLPLERVRSELFNAGVDWEEALASDAIAAYATTVVEAYKPFADTLSRAESAADAITSLANDARERAERVGYSPALTVADRALRALLVRSLASSGRPVSDLAREDAAEAWRAARPPSTEGMTTLYLGEVLAQYARHTVAREAGRLASEGEGQTARVSRLLARKLGEQAAQVAEQVTPLRGPPGQAWSRMISRAFELGRRLPPADQHLPPAIEP
jgi:hypothetical protein